MKLLTNLLLAVVLPMLIAGQATADGTPIDVKKTNGCGIHKWHLVVFFGVVGEPAVELVGLAAPVACEMHVQGGVLVVG